MIFVLKTSQSALGLFGFILVVGDLDLELIDARVVALPNVLCLGLGLVQTGLDGLDEGWKFLCFLLKFKYLLVFVRDLFAQLGDYCLAGWFLLLLLAHRLFERSELFFIIAFILGHFLFYLLNLLLLFVQLPFVPFLHIFDSVFKLISHLPLSVMNHLVNIFIAFSEFLYSLMLLKLTFFQQFFCLLQFFDYGFFVLYQLWLFFVYVLVQFLQQSARLFAARFVSYQLLCFLNDFSLQAWDLLLQGSYLF